MVLSKFPHGTETFFFYLENQKKKAEKILVKLKFPLNSVLRDYDISIVFKLIIYPHHMAYFLNANSMHLNYITFNPS
jgi:hypothetical protein